MCRLELRQGQLIALRTCKMTCGEAVMVLLSIVPTAELDEEGLKKLQEVFPYLRMLYVKRELFPDGVVTGERMRRLFDKACDARQLNAGIRRQTDRNYRPQHYRDYNTVTG